MGFFKSLFGRKPAADQPTPIPPSATEKPSPLGQGHPAENPAPAASTEERALSQPDSAGNSGEQADRDALIDTAMPFALKMLSEQGSFHPFGVSLPLGGEVEMFAAEPGADSVPEAFVEALRQTFGTLARDGKLRGCALAYDILVTLPGGAEKKDAIALAVDLASGHSAVAVYPYAIDASGEVELDEPLMMKGEQRIFQKPV